MGFCYQKNFSNPTLPVDEAQFWALVKASQWNECIDKYRETHDAALKRKLPAFIFQATFDETTSPKGKTGAWRKQSATQLTGLVVMDIDHIESEELRVKSEEFSAADFSQKAKDLGILLIYITPSGHGLKIVFKARLDWGNLIDNQHAMAKVLGVEVDESCKDASRMSFVCKESDILYLNKELFTYENKEFAERYTALYRDGRSQATREDELGTNYANLREENKIRDNSCNSCQKQFKGVAYSEIIDEWWRQNGGVPQEGERNVKLYQLAVSLRAICDNNRQLLMEIMPRLGLSEEEVRSIVESACKEPPKGVSKAMQGVLDGILCKQSEQVGVANASVQTESDIDRRLWEWGELIEGLFDYFPILRDVCKGLKRNQYAPALFVSGGFMMTLMTRCRYSFYHRPQPVRELLISKGF